MGAMGFCVGVTMLSPLVAVPAVNNLGYPGRVMARVPGRLAQHNAARNPQRTATTAAALMIGLTMVTMALTVGDSVKAQLRVTLGEAVHADYLITDNETGNSFTNTIRSGCGGCTAFVRHVHAGGSHPTHHRFDASGRSCGLGCRIGASPQGGTPEHSRRNSFLASVGGG